MARTACRRHPVAPGRRGLAAGAPVRTAATAGVRTHGAQRRTVAGDRQPLLELQPLAKERLFRRGIGRNLAARATTADWIWFTDCDVMFRAGCLDTLAEVLQGRRDALLHPREERATPLLTEDDEVLQRGRAAPAIVDIDDSDFTVRRITRATGPMQITHGDVARACGYCPTLRLYQTPADHFCKAREDRAFRWLLGTQGTAIEVPGIYRIRHMEKGRYRQGSFSKLRKRIRQLQSR